MDAKKLSEKGNITKILIKGIDATWLNSLRRLVMNSIPTFAIEDVSIYENDSVLFDEDLAHRMAMVPIKSDHGKYTAGDKVKFVLDKEGPGIVFSRDIKSTDPKIDILEKNIPISKLKKDQRIKLEAEAVVGTGKVHSKWQPALISYKEIPKVNFDASQIKDAKKFVADCPKGVLELKAGKIIVSDPINVSIDLLLRCADLAPVGAVSIDESDTFVVTIDNFGNHKTLDVFLFAVQAMNEKIGNFRNELKKIKG